eukprot:SAG11_NODE_7920_length_1081_cov_0.679226_1_plen_64_part_10
MPCIHSGDVYLPSDSDSISARGQYIFLRTTLYNLDPNSKLVWVHMLIFYLQVRSRFLRPDIALL